MFLIGALNLATYDQISTKNVIFTRVKNEDKSWDGICFKTIPWQGLTSNLLELFM